MVTEAQGPYGHSQVWSILCPKFWEHREVPGQTRYDVAPLRTPAPWSCRRTSKLKTRQRAVSCPGLRTDGLLYPHLVELLRLAWQRPHVASCHSSYSREAATKPFRQGRGKRLLLLKAHQSSAGWLAGQKGANPSWWLPSSWENWEAFVHPGFSCA